MVIDKSGDAMCKYCECVEQHGELEEKDGTKHKIYYAKRNGGLIMYKSSYSRHPMLEDLEGIYLANVAFCPWCGRNLVEKKIVDIDETIGLIANWGQEHGIDNPDRQTVKLLEECGELAHEISRNRYDSLEVKDAIGDIGVVLIILAYMLGLDFGECLETAYNEIKDRKGETIKGSFVKEEK